MTDNFLKLLQSKKANWTLTEVLSDLLELESAYLAEREALIKKIEVMKAETTDSGDDYSIGEANALEKVLAHIKQEG